MGHLPIVDVATRATMLASSAVRVKMPELFDTNGNLKAHWSKTLADIAADLLCMRPGDAVFPWTIKGGGGGNEGFTHDLRVGDGRPFFDPSNTAFPFGIPLDPSGHECTPMLPETEALDLFRPPLLWNAIGKKSLGRGRGITHQTHPEDAVLRPRLGGARTLAAIGAFALPTGAVSLTIDPQQNQPHPAPTSVAQIRWNQIQWVEGEKFKTEKALEAWLMDNIDGPRCVGLWSLMPTYSNAHLTWFGNYLSYGVSGASIDVATEHEHDGHQTVTAIELKKDGLSVKGYAEAAEQALRYAEYLHAAYAHHGRVVTPYPVVLAGDGNPRGLAGFTPPSRVIGGVTVTPAWVTYRVDPAGNVAFRRIL